MSNRMQYEKFAQAGALARSGPSLAGPVTYAPGADAETYRSEEVQTLLESAAYFSIFNAPNPANPNEPVLLIPGLNFLMTAVYVNEELHRFEFTNQTPTATNGFRTSKTIGEPVADVHIRFTPIPWNFEAAPGKCPPTTLLIPFISQRVAMLEGQLVFKDSLKSGFKAFGTARTFPVSVRGKNQLRVGAAIEILEGKGRFEGLTGAFVINGYIEPPHGLALNLMVRIIDPKGTLQAHAPPPFTPIQPIPDPDPSAAFLVFLGEPDPERPITLNRSPDGRVVSANIYERLRLANVLFDLTTPVDLRSQTTQGPIVGTRSSTLYFYTDPANPAPVSPAQDINGAFTFFDPQRRVIGTLNANMVEGRAFATELSEAPKPILRLTGFGPFISGTGQFANASGMMSINGVLSLFPRALSRLYVLRIEDSDGKFQPIVNSLRS
jgi:hypothetical protein